MFDAFYPISPVNYCLNDFVFELCGSEETNYGAMGESAEHCSRSKLGFTFSDKHLVLEVIRSSSARYRLCDVSSGNRAKVINKNSLKPSGFFGRKSQISPVGPELPNE